MARMDIMKLLSETQAQVESLLYPPLRPLKIDARRKENASDRAASSTFRDKIFAITRRQKCGDSDTGWEEKWCNVTKRTFWRDANTGKDVYTNPIGPVTPKHPAGRSSHVGINLTDVVRVANSSSLRGHMKADPDPPEPDEARPR